MTLDVHFDVPPEIQTGLANGTLERVGGVIREPGSKEVVAWLHESATVNPEQTSGLIGNVMQMSGRGMLGSVGAATPLINLGVSAVTLKLMLERFNRLSAQIAEEFKHDREADYRAALEAVKDAVSVEGNEQFKIQRISQAVDGLHKAQDHLLRDVERALLHNDESAHMGIIRIVHVATLRTRCYLEVGNRERALEKLAESIEALKAHVHEFIAFVLGDYPGIYLHPKLPDENTEQFLDLWLWHRRDELEGDRSTRLLQVIHDLRKDFWNSDAEKPFNQNALLDTAVSFTKDISNKIPSSIPNALSFGNWSQNETSKAEAKPEITGKELLQANLSVALIMRENFERLQGYELQLHSNRLSQENQAHIDEQAQGRDALVVDHDKLNQRIDRLST